MITPQEATKLLQAWDCWNYAIKEKLRRIEVGHLNTYESLFDVALRYMNANQMDCKQEINEINAWLDDDAFPDLTFNR